MNELREILSLIEKYGLSLVLLLVILFWLRPKIDDLWKLFIGKNKDGETNKEQEDRCLRELLENETSINLLLQEIMLKHNAVRAIVWQFHNGVRSINGIPFMKLSVTHEQTKVIPVMNVYQNIPISFISQTVEKILKDDYAFIRDTDTIFPGTVSEMRSIGAKALLYIPIRDTRDCLFGILAITFMDERTLSEEDILEYKEYAYRLTAILETMAGLSVVADRRCRNAIRS